MSDLVYDIERIVGMPRHPTLHYGRAVSAERKVYILHSQRCCNHRRDLRYCPYSLALDNGINPAAWVGHEDMPVMLRISAPSLRVVPAC